MPARNHSQWTATPPVEFVDSRIYSDPDIFEEELEKLTIEIYNSDIAFTEAI